jgi:hypothetical protein
MSSSFCARDAVLYGLNVDLNAGERLASRITCGIIVLTLGRNLPYTSLPERGDKAREFQ